MFGVYLAFDIIIILVFTYSSINCTVQLEVPFCNRIIRGRIKAYYTSAWLKTYNLC